MAAMDNSGRNSPPPPSPNQQPLPAPVSPPRTTITESAPALVAPSSSTPVKFSLASADTESPKKKMQKSEASPTKFGTPASQEARMLNIGLENALQVTLRLEVADGSTYYLGDLVTSGEMLSSSNLSEVICARLTSRGDILNAVSYLVGCYKRITAKEITASGNLRDELLK